MPIYSKHTTAGIRAPTLGSLRHLSRPNPSLLPYPPLLPWKARVSPSKRLCPSSNSRAFFSCLRRSTADYNHARSNMQALPHNKSKPNSQSHGWTGAKEQQQPHLSPDAPPNKPLLLPASHTTTPQTVGQSEQRLFTIAHGKTSCP